MIHDGHHVPGPDVAALAAPLLRDSKKETGGILPMAHFTDFFRKPVGTAPPFRIRKASVNGDPVSVGHGGNVISGFRPAFDLQGGHAGVDQLPDVFQKAEILGV